MWWYYGYIKCYIMHTKRVLHTYYMLNYVSYYMFLYCLHWLWLRTCMSWLNSMKIVQHTLNYNSYFKHHTIKPPVYHWAACSDCAPWRWRRVAAGAAVRGLKYRPRGRYSAGRPTHSGSDTTSPQSGRQSWNEGNPGNRIIYTGLVKIH